MGCSLIVLFGELFDWFLNPTPRAYSGRRKIHHWKEFSLIAVIPILQRLTFSAFGLLFVEFQDRFCFITTDTKFCVLHDKTMVVITYKVIERSPDEGLPRPQGLPDIHFKLFAVEPKKGIIIANR